jgi:MFS family permease
VSLRPAVEAPAAAPDSRPLLRRTFAALEGRDFRIFWVGQLISVTGTWMQSVAQGWLVLQLTGSPFLLGVAVAARSLPVLILGVPAGVAADRFDRRRLIIATSLLSMVVATLLAALTISNRIDFGMVVALAIVAGSANAIEMPARQSLVVELAGRGQLANAIALNSLLFNGARVIGPALAGLIVAVYGPGWAFAVNAATFVPVIIGLLMIGPALVERARVATRGAIGELIAYLRLETRVGGLLLLLAFQTAFASGHLIIGPAVAEQLGVGAQGLGFLLAATGLGAVVAGLRLAAYPDRGSRRRVLTGAGLLLAAALAAVGFSTVFALTLACFAAAGFGMVTFNATANTLIQTIVSEHLRGRVMSLYTIVQLGLLPAGSLLMGALADAAGAAQALAIGGGLWGVTVVTAFGLSRRLRAL